jgi:hypothetical protein
MNIRSISAALLALGIVVVAGCSSHGPDVIDPASLERTESSLIAVASGGDGEIVHYSEKGGVVSSNDYANSNGGQRSKPIDAIYEHGDTLYLHHRSAGEISLLDLRTRKEVASIAGFPAGADGALNGMAFSNQSQAWVICDGSPNLYHVDIYYHKIAGVITLPGIPTSVATDSIFIYVGMRMPDGSGQIGMLRSNSGGPYTIEKTFNVPTPPVFMTRSGDGLQMYVLTSGSPNGDVKPALFGLDVINQNLLPSFDIDAPSLASYIGSEPNFVAMTRGDFMYVAFPSSVIQIDVPAQLSTEIIAGSFSVLDIEPTTSLLYAAAAGSTTIKRWTVDAGDIGDVSIPSPINAIRFVNSTTLP